MKRIIAGITVGLFMGVMVPALAQTGPTGPTGATGPSGTTTTSLYYANCDQTPGPLLKGEPGYRTALDKDGDGVACDNEKVNGTTTVPPTTIVVTTTTPVNVLSLETINTTTTVAAIQVSPKLAG